MIKEIAIIFQTFFLLLIFSGPFPEANWVIGIGIIGITTMIKDGEKTK